MKTRNLLLSILATALMAGCGTEETGNGIPAEDMAGKAFLSLSMKSAIPVPERAAATEEKPGTENESKATTVTALLFDEMNICIDVADFSGTVVGNSNGAGNASATSEAKPVSAKAKKVFVVINPYYVSPKGWDLSPAAVKGKSWDTINAVMTDAAIANVATDASFMMTSAGTALNGPLTPVNVYKPASETDQAAIEAAKTQAENNAVEILIDRLAAKVTVSLKAGGVDKPAGADFSFLGWDLSVTNRSVRLYSDLIAYADATAGAVYRRDNNYLASEQPSAADPTALKAAFSYLSNIENAAGIMPAVARAAATDAYCLENTMEASAQKVGFTTKAVVKAKYSPSGFALGDSYFFWNGSYYTLAKLQADYLTHAEGTGLRKDLPIFLHKAGIMAADPATLTLAQRDAAVAALTANSFNDKSGIVGRYCAVRYYHESVCYYDVLIRHDQNVTGKMALGKYGMVRNNWYGLTINSVSNPGTPWIPDPSDADPTNPTKPDTDDDEGNAYLSVKITVNPWTYWSQGVELK